MVSVTKDEVSPDVLRQVADELGHYVYALVDPRNGIPFYIGERNGGSASRLTAEKPCGPMTAETLRVRWTSRPFQTKCVKFVT